MIVVSLIAIVAIRASRDDDPSTSTATRSTTVDERADADDGDDDGGIDQDPSDGDGGGESSDASGGTTDGTLSIDGGVPGGETTTGGAAGGASIAALEAALVNGDDLPRGWTVFAGVEADPTVLTQGCALPADVAKPQTSRQRTFRLGSTGPIVTNVVAHYDSPATATAAFAALRSTLAGCIGRGPGAAGEARIASAADPSVGADESAAATLTAEAGELRASGELAYARVGQRIVSVSTVAPADDDPRLAIDVLRAVVGRLAG